LPGTRFRPLARKSVSPVGEPVEQIVEAATRWKPDRHGAGKPTSKRIDEWTDWLTFLKASLKM
jgi:hypothetical protein